MKLPRLLLGLCLTLPAVPGRGASPEDTLDEINTRAFIQPPTAPDQDARGLIRASSSFLKEREPEMTAEEYALYEKIAAMLETNPTLAVTMLERMTSEKEPPSPAFAFILGNAYAAASQPDRSEASYRSAVTRYPTFQRAWINLGLLYYSNSRYGDAAGAFAKAVALGERESSTLGLLGYCLEQQGDAIAAEAAYTQALGAEPKNADWKEGLLRLALNDKQYDRAERLVRGLIAEKPAETRFWLNYAGILTAAGRRLEAMAVLEQALAAGVVDENCTALLGDLYAEQGLAAEAAELYGKLLATARPRGEQKILQFAQVLVAAGSLADAEKVLAPLAGDLSPATRQALLLIRADLAMARQRWPEARREIESLLTLAPLHGRALLLLGRTHLEENNLPRATLAFEAALQAPESAYQAHLELANVELKNRHYASAISHLEKALRLQRSDEIEAYLARIRTLVAEEDKSG